MSERTDKEFLLDILEACKRIEKYTANMKYEEFLEREETQDAVIRNLEIIGEAVKNLSREFKREIFKCGLEENSRYERQTHTLLLWSES